MLRPGAFFHGSGDNEATWTEFGKADVILDNLIAAGKAKPMIVVMPDGHTSPPMPRDAPGAAEARNKNLGSVATANVLLAQSAHSKQTSSKFQTK